MSILKRSWVVVLLCLVSLILALVLPPGATGGGSILFRLSFMFAGLLLFAFLWARFNLMGVKVSRQLRSDRSQVGKYIEERFIVENTGPFPKLWLELRDHSQLPAHLASRVVSSLSARHQRSWVVKSLCHRRGRFRLGPLTLYSGDPFGLFLLHRELDLLGSVVVYPPTFELPGFSLSVGQLVGGESLRRRTHHVTSNVSGIRDYVPGDSFGRIHWPSTARTSRLIVKEFELDPLVDVWLFLDMDRQVHVGQLSDASPDLTLPSVFRVLKESPSQFELDRSTQEYAVAIAASLAKHFLHRGWSLGMITYPQGRRRELAQADRGERQLDRLLSTLAVVQSEGVVPLAQVLAAETVQLTRNSMAIVITPSPDPDWVAAIRHLTVRGVRTMTVLIDRSTFADEEGGVVGAKGLVGDLLASRVPSYVVSYGDSLEMALSESGINASVG